MAINPAPMGQCNKKTRCVTGPNQGLAYDPKDPCPPGHELAEDICDCCSVERPCSNGISGTLVSHITSKAGWIEVTTFYPSLVGGFASGCAFADSESVRIFDGKEFVTVSAPPYREGDTYLGETITYVVHTIQLSGECN